MGLSRENSAWLNQHFGENVVFDEPMHRHTSFHIGGPADAFVRPRDLPALVTLTAWCRENGLPCFVLGKGTNLLVRDNGIRGVVISAAACLNQIRHEKLDENLIRVSAMAGVGLQRLCRYAMDNGFSGMNFAVGIPGSLGGAIMMNAGTSDGCMADVIETVTVCFFSGENEKIKKEDLNFSYRKFSINNRDDEETNNAYMIIEADIILKASDPESLKIDARKKLERRKATQPVHMFSPGCIFKNPESGLPAGRLIDDAGLKGKCIGDAEVSSRHGNYIVNRGQATADDVIKLIQLIKDCVLEKFSIHLDLEVIIVGE